MTISIFELLKCNIQIIKYDRNIYYDFIYKQLKNNKKGKAKIYISVVISKFKEYLNQINYHQIH